MVVGAGGATALRNLSSGEVSYNGFKFPGPIGARIQSAPVYDEAERYVKYIKYTLTIETIISSDDLLDTEESAFSSGTAERTGEIMDDLRVRLQASGGHLKFTTQGFGTLEVNGAISTTQHDISFGPHPRLLVWEPIGSNRAVRIAWICDTTVPECTERMMGYGQFQYVSSFEYEIGWSINEDGMTNRRIIGQIESPNKWLNVEVDTTGVTNMYAQTTVDALRDELLKIPAIPGFHRTHDIRANKARTELHFSIIDQEIPSDNAYHPGMIDIDANHSIYSKLFPSGGAVPAPMGFNLWQGRLSARFKVAPGLSKFVSWFAFLIILNQRVGHLIQAVHGDPTWLQYKDYDEEQKTKKNFPYYPLSLRISEDIYARTTNFQFTYLFQSAPKDLLGSEGKSQLFEPVSAEGHTSTLYSSEVEWAAWTDALTEKVHHPRGYAKLGHLSADDRRITLCSRSPGITTVTNQYAVMPTTGAVNFLTAECPPEDRSWLKYDMNFRIVNNERLVEIIQLGPIDLTKLESNYQHVQSTDDLTNRTRKEGGFNISTPNNIAERRKFYKPVHGKAAIVLEGYGVRLGFPIHQPVLKSIMGRIPMAGMNESGREDGWASVEYNPVATAYSTFDTKKVADVGEDCPLYVAKWRIVYYIYLGPGVELDLKSIALGTTGLSSTN